MKSALIFFAGWLCCYAFTWVMDWATRRAEADAHDEHERAEGP